MSIWRYKIGEAEIGPLEFRSLADLLRRGEISERTLVCREGSAVWEPAWHVAGLVEAPRRAPQLEQPPQTPSEGCHDSAAASGAPREKSYAHAAAMRAAIAGLTATLLVGLVYRWVYWRTMVFPPRRQGDLPVHWFPLVGECNGVEYALLYVDLFTITAGAAWCLCGSIMRRRQ